MNKLLLWCLYLLGLPKSLWVNLRLCPRQAWCLPIIVSHKTRLLDLSGRVELSRLRPGIVRIGFGRVETQDFASQHTLLSLKGVVRFAGKAKIGFGSRLSVEGVLEIGHGFQISAAGTTICRKRISLGHQVLMAWESLLTDSDLHVIVDAQSRQRLNPDAQIVIGDHVWLGARSFITKGSQIADACIVGAQSLVPGRHLESNCLLAGNPAAVLRRHVSWQE